MDSQAAQLFPLEYLPARILPFPLFLVAVTAELNRPPFDLTEGEQELVGGFHTEYSSIRFALFFLAEFMNTITMSAVMVTLFFGGPDGPGFHFVRWLWPILWFLGKTVVFLYVYVWIRAALPRLRYDQLMDARLEGADPLLARLAARRGRLQGGHGLGHRGLPRASVVAGGPVRRRSASRGRRREAIEDASPDGAGRPARRRPPAGRARARRRSMMADEAAPRSGRSGSSAASPSP